MRAAIITIIILILIIWMGQPSKSPSPPSMPQAESAESTEAKTRLATAIREYGFNCKSVWNVGSRGEDEYGRVFRVRCGPISGYGSPDQLPQFRLTIRPNGRVIVIPWE
jgi:hypothetical protein